MYGSSMNGSGSRMVKKKKDLVDESIQGTNDSSIVSKRSVERLYWTRGDRRHTEFFRHFVTRPIRRSPVINRGYWTRMEAMKSVINKVVNREFSGKKIIVNLGCGYDPYPFQYLGSADSKNQDIIFIDVDYPDLVKKKVKTVLASSELSAIIGRPKPDSHDDDKLLLRTDFYIALGCDLRDVEGLENSLRSVIDVDECLILFTAEVSLTYMIQTSADALIQWASTLPNAEFALLEQIIPGGELHPFATTMLNHFNSLNTPLNSVLAYPRLVDQIDRFKSRGWKSVSAQDLWNFWRDCISEPAKSFVASVEDFDEWEEFILFGQHYFILHASTASLPSTCQSEYSHPTSILPLSFITKTLPQLQRKFAASALLDSGSLLIHGGLTTIREGSSVVLSNSDQSVHMDSNPSQGRMCHTLTRLSGGDILLVGGRMNPSKSLSDCWLMSNGHWKRVQDLPEPRYRHCAVSVGNDLVLVYGGTRLDSPWLLWSREDGWIRVKNHLVSSRFSSAMSWDTDKGRGVLVGGMDKNGIIHQDAFILTLQGLILNVTELSSSTLLARYGAKATFVDSETVIIAGGVSPLKLFDASDMFVTVDLSSSVLSALPIVTSSPIPLLVGFNMDFVDEHLVVYGGGCICFSFGSFWNDVVVILPKGQHQRSESFCSKLQTVSPRPIPRQPPTMLSHIPSVKIKNQEEFQIIHNMRQPALFEKNDLGSCMEKWKSAQYLIDKIGGDRKVVAHVSEFSFLNFTAKNFDYQILDFKEFVSQMFSDKSNIYLRSLSADRPKDSPAMFRDDFKEIAPDFHLPDFLSSIEQTHYSSPLRLSSANTSMWLHYDVTANVLCQIVGEKRVRLYPPHDVIHLSFPAGSSSSTIANIFDMPSLDNVHPIEVVMRPGDILFIPSMWLHATLPLCPSVSLNFFWKDLSHTMYATGKDVYGNRDITAYENGRKFVNKVIDGFEGVPEEIRRFYLLRLADELNKSVN
jgi:tRNA wybutosine-synthesizing protein 4